MKNIFFRISGDSVKNKTGIFKRRLSVKGSYRENWSRLHDWQSKKNQTKHRKITWTASIRELPFKKQNFPGWKRRWKKADKEENMFPGAVVSYIVPLHYCKMNIQ